MFVLLAVLGFIFQLVWLLLKRYFTRAQRQQTEIYDFKTLHPYEQLAVIWLLDAGREQQQFIQNAFTQSGLLRGVIDSRLYIMQQEYPQALSVLNQSHAMAFELAEIQRIQVYLAQQDGEQALTHLEFLTQHELSPWLKDVQAAYEQRLTELWGVFAVQFPWLYLRSMQYGHLDEVTKQAWLEQLLQQFDRASAENLQDLQQRYIDLSAEIETRSYHIKMLWLKLLSRLPDLSQQHENLALHLLDQQFNAEVFYLWFQQQLLKQVPNYSDVEQHIQDWELKYPSLPVLTFAKWHVYEATDRLNKADALLTLYPDNVLMNYLRIKSTLKNREDLIQQLNLIFENNANFMKIKI
jgi:hypothetical protein